MSNKLKSTPFLVITSPVLNIGGTEFQMLTLVKALINENYRIGILCYYEFNETMIERFKKEGAEIFLLNLKRKPSCSFFSIFSLIVQLYKWFKKFKPDVVNVQYLAPGFTAICIAKLARVPRVIATIHVSGTSFYSKKAIILFRISAWLCDAFICVSQSTEQFWFGKSKLFEPGLELKKQRHFTIYNSVDIKKIECVIANVDKETLFQRYSIPKNKWILGIVGRLAVQKGHRFLFQALCEVREDINFHLLVIGHGAQREYLQGLANELDIFANITWIDETSQEEVFAFYSIMHILLVPSLYEGFGLVAAEGMAAGLPIIATDVDGLREVVQHNKTGLLVLPGNVPKLAASIKFLYSNPKNLSSFQVEGRKYVTEHFSFDNYQKIIIELIKQLL